MIVFLTVISLVNQAIFMEEAGYAHSAHKLLEEALEKNPPTWQQAVIYYNLGVLALKEKNYLDALLHFYRGGESKTPPYLQEPLKNQLSITGENIHLELPSFTNKDLHPLEKKKAYLAVEDTLLNLYKDKNLLIQQMIENKKETSENFEDASKKAKLIIPAFLSWQELLYKNGVCLTNPWPRIIFLFDQGNEELNLAKNQNRIDQQYILISQTIDHWEEMLKLLDDINQSSSEEKKEENSLPQKIREMQLQDGSVKPSVDFVPKVLRPW